MIASHVREATATPVPTLLAWIAAGPQHDWAVEALLAGVPGGATVVALLRAGRRGEAGEVVRGKGHDG